MPFPYLLAPPVPAEIRHCACPADLAFADALAECGIQLHFTAVAATEKKSWPFPFGKRWWWLPRK